MESRHFICALSASVSARFPHLVFPHRSLIFGAVSSRFALVDSIKRSVKKKTVSPIVIFVSAEGFVFLSAQI
jgi:hypothetical protein